MQIKIFSGEKPLYLTDKLTGKLKTLSSREDVLLFDEATHPDALALLENMKNEKINAAIITGKSTEALKKDFFDQLTVIEAAGGVVQNENKDILFIFRRGKWDLPKGKMEKGETPELCAEREIEEETGTTGLTRKKKIGETYHIYREKDKDILKISHWFYFTCTGKQALVPQTIEDITEVTWISTKDIKKPMENTFENIRDILSSFFDTP